MACHSEALAMASPLNIRVMTLMSIVGSSNGLAIEY
jgi:hypothetical protein